MSCPAYKISFFFFISRLHGEGILGEISRGALRSNKGIDHA